MYKHVKVKHGAHLRLNCKVSDGLGVCSWSCGSYMYCMNRHLSKYHEIEDVGTGEFPLHLIYWDTTNDPLPKGVS